MRKSAAAGWLLTALLFGAAYLTALTPSAEPAPSPSSDPAPVLHHDADTTLAILDGDTLQTMTLADYLAGKQYTATVYAAETQKPGTQTTHDGQGTTGEDTQLSRYDNVVIKVA